MRKVFNKASWIWYEQNDKKDSYGDFKDSFNFTGNKTVCNITCDGDYTLYVNGHFVASNQYGDFEHYKVYDTIDITNYLNIGKNTIDITVWHIGVASSRYREYRAGLLYEVISDGKTLCKSDENTLSRENPYYKSDYKKIITVQMGQSFLYDATKPETDYHKSFIAYKKYNLFPRPIRKSELLEEVKTTILKSEGNHYLIDLGEETVGLPTLRFNSNLEQKVTVFWGEHIIDDCVRGKIGGRNFSYEYIAKKGENNYTNYMLRLGCRYLEVFSEEPIEVNYIGLIPQVYPVEVLPHKFKEPLKQKIYDACVNTLKLCIMEHYVDTPWREQSFYALDSRNQIACGYKAFKNGNADYVRASLLLIGQDDRKDGLLSITYPSGGTLAIPSFSLHYFQAVKEYIEFTNDLSLIDEIYDKLFGIIKAFEKQICNGLLYTFKDQDYWNYYEWATHMEEPIGATETRPDFMINVLFLYALKNFKFICDKADKPFPFDEVRDTLKKNVKEAFFDAESGLFSISIGGKEFCELSNSLAILCELTNLKETRVIAEKLASGALEKASLSMKCFKYDALLKVSSRYRKNILNEIFETYEPMVNSGATTVFEVESGASAFGNAGSLCHGWSAIPILYL